MTITILREDNYMYAIVELIFLILLLPVFLFGFILWKIGKTITDNFEPIQLLSCIWLSIVAYSLLPYREVDDSRPFVSLIETVAQSHFLGFSTPMFIFSIAGILFFTSIVFAKFRIVK